MFGILDVGLEFIGLLLYVSLDMDGIILVYWGSNFVGCSFASCPTAADVAAVRGPAKENLRARFMLGVEWGVVQRTYQENTRQNVMASQSVMSHRVSKRHMEHENGGWEAVANMTKELLDGKGGETSVIGHIGLRGLPTHGEFRALMTTSVGNKSVFRNFFKKQKLTGPNFIDWYRQLRLVISTKDKENYLEHPIPEAPVAPPGQQVPPTAAAAYGAWVKGQKEVDVLLLLTMDLDIQWNLTHLGAYDMLQELKAMFSKQAEQEILHIVREFHACKQEKGQSASSYVLKIKSYIDNLEHLGQPVSQNLAVSLILVSLNKDMTASCRITICTAWERP
uniref:Zinc finger, CCHC-type n=1 Tax=Tanacetum cinerariifolium TaxID=118510 RepID=A0A6L2M835_TANCI|nr:zinc finger, CCHC-type [Tanacetum cinerariifolium]